MKAIALRHFGGPDVLSLEMLPDPDPGPGEILLAVRACGVCHHDLLARRGALPNVPLPTVLGHEVVGEVLALGEGVTGFRVGDRAATLQRMHCGDCAECARERTSLCKVDRRFFGEEISGGYATRMVAPTRGLVAVPSALSDEDAAIACCTTGTAVHVCRARGHIRAGHDVLVTGASGGVGLQAIRLAVLDGARVIAVTSSDDKVAVLENAGAAHVVVTRALRFADEVKRLTRGRGVDVALEIVGAPTFDQTLKCMAPGGRVVVVGNIEEGALALSPGLVIVKELEIVGAYATSRTELEAAFRLVASKRIASCVSEIAPLEHAADLHRRLERRAVAGRAVLVTS